MKEISKEEKTQFTMVNWENYMASRCGSVVCDEVTGKFLTWGEALLHEVYGRNKEDVVLDEEPIPLEVVRRATSWRRGRWPEWAKSGEVEEGKNFSAFVRGHPLRTRVTPIDGVIYRKAI